MEDNGSMEPVNTEPPQEPPVDTTEHQPLHLSSIHPALSPKKSKMYLLVVLVVLVLAALGFGAFKVFGSKKPANVPSSGSPPETSQQSAATVSVKDVSDATGSQTYDNGFLGVKLSYPSNWAAIESESKDSVRLESPDFSYQTLGKGAVTGNFRIYIRKGARDVDGKYIGRGYAIQPSEKLAYSKPVAGQRADTNLSLFGLDTSDNFAFFLIAGNYSLNKGDTLGPSYGKETETFIIAGGYSAKDLKDDLATNTVSVELIKTSNAYKQAINVLKSLQLQ